MALVYAGLGARQTPPETRQAMTTIAGWLAPQGWHLASGGARGADTAFARGAPADQRTLYLPWADYNRHAGPDCVIPQPADMEACVDLAARLHPTWTKCSKRTRLLHGRNAAILLGPRLDTPVNAVVAWTPGGEVTGGTGMGLRIAAEHGIEVLNLATVEPRTACERLLDIRRGLSAAAPRPDAPARRNAPDERTYAAADVAAFRFTRAQYGELSNFAPLSQPIAAGPWTFATTEHLYQAAKFTRHPEIQARIAAAPTARDAARIGRSQDLPVDPDWNERRVDVMRWIIRLKHATNPALIGAQLADTADRPIVEHSSRDPFWGARLVGVEYRGSNILGRLWMELRQQLRDNDPATDPAQWAERARVGRLAAPSRSEEVRAEPAAPATSRSPEPLTPSEIRNRRIDPGIVAPHPELASSLAPPHGPAPDPDGTRRESDQYRIDDRDAWDAHDADAAVRAAYATLRDICPDDTPLGPERQALSHGLVHALKSTAKGLWDRVDGQRYQLDQAREIDRGLHDSHAAEAEDLRARFADDRAYANYLHSERGRRDHSRRGRRRDPDAIARRGVPDPRKSPRGPFVPRAAGASRSNADPEDIPEIAEGHRNLVRRANALDEIAEIAAKCYRAEFGEDWLAPRNPVAFRNDRSTGLSRIREQREKVDPRVRLASWLTQWRILRQRAINKDISIAGMPAYANMVGKAHDLWQAKADLSAYERKWLRAFLDLHPRQTPAPEAPDRWRGHDGPAAGSPWDRERALAALNTLVDTVDSRVLANGTQLDDERERVLWSLGQWLYREHNRVAARVRSIAERGDPIPDGLRASVTALTDLRNGMATIYRERTGSDWTPDAPYARHGAKRIAAAEIEALKLVRRHDYASAASRRVKGTCIAVSGSEHWIDADRIHRALDAKRSEYPDMILMHGGAAGAATIARSWASDRGVDQVIYLPQTNKHGPKAAPLRRNEEMLDDKPQLVVSFDGPGDPEPIAAEAEKRKIPVQYELDPALPARDYSPSAPDPAPAAAPAAIDSNPSPPAASPPAQDSPRPAEAPRQPAPAAVSPDPPTPPESAFRTPTGHACHPSNPDAAPASGPAPEAPAAPAPDDAYAGYPDPAETAALCDRMDDHFKAIPARWHHIVDGRLLHYREAPAFQAWAKKTEQLLRLLDPATDFDDPSPHAQLLDRIAESAKTLECVLDEVAPRDLIDELHISVTRQYDQIVQDRRSDHPLSWIYHPDTPDLIGRIDALVDRIDGEQAFEDADRLKDHLSSMRHDYDVAMEKRQDLDRIDARLEKHLDDRQNIREAAAETRLLPAEHSAYEKWEERLDDLENDVSNILDDRDAYRHHLEERPELAANIRCNLDLLVTARDDDRRRARTVPPPPSAAPEPEPMIAEAPTLEPAPSPAPEPVPIPEPRPEPAPRIEDEGPSMGF